MNKLIVAVALAMVVGSAQSAEPTVSALKSRWEAANGACRGSIGTAAEIDAICARREAITRALEARGQCFVYVRNPTGGRDPVWSPCRLR